MKENINERALKMFRKLPSITCSTKRGYRYKHKSFSCLYPVHVIRKYIYEFLNLAQILQIGTFLSPSHHLISIKICMKYLRLDLLA